MQLEVCGNKVTGEKVRKITAAKGNKTHHLKSQ